jgi:excisionase family DNA binding protein
VPDLNPSTDHPADDPWLTLAEVADELRVNPSTVRLWVSQGRLSASRAGRRKWLVRRSELDRMLGSERTAEPRPADEGAGPIRPPMPGDRLIFDSGGGGGEGSGG